MRADTAKPEAARATQEGQAAGPSMRQPWPAFTRFLRACQHAMLYPPEHFEFKEALQRAFEGCRELLAIFPTCTVQLDAVGMQLMGRPCPEEGATERLIARLQERSLPVLTFREGITREELLALVEMLKAEPEVVEEYGGAAAWLKRSGVTHISLEAPRAAATPVLEAWESFLAHQEPADREALEQLLAICPGASGTPLTSDEEPAALTWLAGALGQAAEAQEPEAREAWLRAAASGVRALTAGLRGRLFRIGVRPEGDVLRDLAGQSTAEEAAEILVSPPNAVVGEPSEQLEAVLSRLMPTVERAREVEPVAKAMLLARGMTEESYVSVVSLMLKKKGGAAGPLPQEQRNGVRDVSLLTDFLPGTSPRALQESRVDMWLELIASPAALGNHASLVQSLAEALPESLTERPDSEAVELLRRVEELISLEVLTPEEKRLLRMHLMGACTTDLCRRLVRVMLREPERGNGFLLWMVSQAEGGFDGLFRIAKETPRPWLQGAAGGAMVRMGERSAEACYGILRGGLPEDAVALARALARSGTREGLERAVGALEHRDPRVAAGLMEALAQSREPLAERVLLEGLRHSSAEVQRAAARSLGGRPSEQAVAALQAVLKRRSLFSRGALRKLWAAATQALARIPQPSAEEVLREEARRGTELAMMCAEALALRRLVLSLEQVRGTVR